jgi:hypothetical protein
MNRIGKEVSWYYEMDKPASLRAVGDIWKKEIEGNYFKIFSK